MSLTSYRAAPPRAVPPRGYGGERDGPGGDLLFRALRRSTIGAEGFHGRVRDGIGCFAPRYGHQARFENYRFGDWEDRVRSPAFNSPGLTPGLSEASCVCVPAERGSAAKKGLPPGSCFGVLLPDASSGRMILAAGCGHSSAVERLVPVGCAGCPASTSGLSTWWSTTALGETWF